MGTRITVIMGATHTHTHTDTCARMGVHTLAVIQYGGSLLARVYARVWACVHHLTSPYGGESLWGSLLHTRHCRAAPGSDTIRAKCHFATLSIYLGVAHFVARVLPYAKAISHNSGGQ